MLVATKAGNTYTKEEVRADLASAGFVNIRLVLDGTNMDQVIEGQKPR
jgi:hypothetical protein